MLETFGNHIGVKLVVGESSANIDTAHILITVPGFLYNKLTSRKVTLDFSHLKMVVYDEADELLIQKDNHKFFEEFQKHLKKIEKNP